MRAAPTLAVAVALLAGLAPLPAQAGPAEEERQVAMLTARREGEEAAKRGDHAACAAAYLRAFEIDSRQDGDELLYNAGVCFELAGEIDPALAAWRRLGKSFPRSKMRPRALVRSGNLLALVVRFEEAAAAFEEYGDLYGGEKDAREAMSYAARFRFALGHHRRAIAITRRWIKTYQSKLTPQERARALLFIASVQEEMGDRRAGLRSLDEAMRTAGGRDPELAGWIRARKAALEHPPPRERPATLPERFDRRGIASDLLGTAPLAD